MTKVWGPMGWMTLHSISVNYPDTPSNADKHILSEFMTAFANCITCVHCRQHFNQMFSDYRNRVPTWLDSRRDLFIAICRMHNMVNKRLDKPQSKTISESLEWLKRATSYTTPRDFRQKYSEYLLRDWGYQRQTGDGHEAYSTALKLKKINEEYWNHRETSYDSVTFEEADIVSYSSTVVSQQTQSVLPKVNIHRLLGLRR
jgi:hypothetical protein